MNLCENKNNKVRNDNNNNNNNDTTPPQQILTVPRAEYLVWCKRRMELGDNSSNFCLDAIANPTTPHSNTTTESTASHGTLSTLKSKQKQKMTTKTTTTTTTVTPASPPKGSPFGFALPPELLLEILSYLKESQSALYSVSLVCRQWMLCAAPLLYRHVKIIDTFRYATFILTLTRNKKTLYHGSLVHTLDLAAGNKLFGKQANMMDPTSTNTIPGAFTIDHDQQQEQQQLDPVAHVATGTAEGGRTAETSLLQQRQSETGRRGALITTVGGVVITRGNHQNENTTTTTTDWTFNDTPTNNDNNTNANNHEALNNNNNNNTTATLLTTITNNNENNDNNDNNNNNNNNQNHTNLGWIYHQRQQQQQQLQQETNNESEYYEARDMKHGHLFVTTSSLLQVAKTCKNLTCLNMSLTTLFHDSMIEETGEYVSTLQHYAVQPGLTHILIPMSKVIETLGKECPQLQEVKMQRCDWVTTHTIWLWVTHCPKLIRLDARRSNKCSVKKLIANILEAEPNQHQQDQQHQQQLLLQHQHQQQYGGGMMGMVDDAPMLDHSEEEEERIFFGTIRQPQPPPQHHFPHHHPQPTVNNTHINRASIPHPIQAHELINIRMFRDDFETFDTTLTQRLQQRRVSRRPNFNRRTSTRSSANASTSSSASVASNPSSSSTFSSSSENQRIEWRSLKQVVYDILKDAKDLGAELPWFS